MLGAPGKYSLEPAHEGPLAQGEIAALVRPTHAGAARVDSHVVGGGGSGIVTVMLAHVLDNAPHCIPRGQLYQEILRRAVLLGAVIEPLDQGLADRQLVRLDEM